MAECQSLRRSRRRAPKGAGGDEGRRLGAVIVDLPPPLAGEEIYLSGCPIVTLSVPTPSTSHSILSPATVAATPDGVPVMMMSPAASSTISESFAMISGTFQIIWLRSPSWRIFPVHLRGMRPLLGWTVSQARQDSQCTRL